MITINLNKAKEITKTRLRLEREPLLKALDIEVMKNLNNAEALTEIEAEKQRLRDITKLADIATTTDELKAIAVQ